MQYDADVNLDEQVNENDLLRMMEYFAGEEGALE